MGDLRQTMRRVLRRGPAEPREPWIDERIPGWMTRPELEVIARAAATVAKDGVIVEIGSFAGRSSVHWAANSDPSVRIFCMDPFDAIVDEFSLAHIQGEAGDVAGRPSGELFARHTSDWAARLTPIAQASPPPSWDQPADVIFVDGDHTAEGVTRDLEFWVDWLKPGGTLLGHDWDDPRVREAVETFAAARGASAWPHPTTNVWQLYPG
jgi:predicted O-methyltransferase YrrM